MFKQTLRFVFYLIISILIGIAVTLTIDHFENIAVEKKVRKDLESELRGAVSSFNSYSNNHAPEESIKFIKKFSVSSMQDRVIAVDSEDKIPDKDKFKYLFTFKDGGRRVDFYIINAYLQGELGILENHELVLGLMTIVAIFTIMVLYSEKKRQRREMRIQMEIKHEEFRKTLKEQETLALLGRMSATLAHELKTPVATISNMVQVLPARIKDEKFTDRFIAITGEELKRTQQLIDNLLVYGKEIGVAGREWIHLKPFIGDLAERDGLIISGCSDVNLLCDKFYMGLLLENLLRNSRAAKATGVNVSLNSDKGGMVEMSFEDDGAGFPADTDLEQLLNPFITMRSSGAGLGLYLVKKIGAAHGWKIQLFRPANGAGIRIIISQGEVRINEG